MTYGIGHSRSASVGDLRHADTQVVFSEKNCDSRPGERLSFARHFREISAHNESIDLVASFEETSPGSKNYEQLLAQLSIKTTQIKSLIEIAQMRVDGRIVRDIKTQGSDQVRLRNLTSLLGIIRMVAPHMPAATKDALK